MSLDPGHTTGYAFWKDGELTDFGEVNTKDISTGIDNLSQLLMEVPLTEVVAEDYRVYKWKSKHHEWSELHTPRLIGVIECLCWQNELPLFKQPAHIAKNFANDEKLKAWGFWKPGMRHARDAIRHGIYFSLFGEVTALHKSGKNTVG